MAGEHSLSQLRLIRDKIRRLDAEREDLVEGRNVLIRQADEAGFSQQQIATAADLSQSRIQEVITGRR